MRSPQVENAVYHLGYEELDGQPILALHTDGAYFEGLASSDNKYKLDVWRARANELGGDIGPYTFNDSSFGYESAGYITPSDRALGWSALKLPLPKGQSDVIYLSTPTPQLLPVASTLYSVFKHIHDMKELGFRDPNTPRLMSIGVSVKFPVHEHQSAIIQADLSPEMLRRLGSIVNLESAQERVRQAMYKSFSYVHRHVRDGQFEVDLGKDFLFAFPTDDQFYAPMPHAFDELRLVCTKSNFLLHQISILGGLAALNDIVLES